MQTNVRIEKQPEESARDYAYRALSLMIYEMVLRPGEKIVESEIAARLELSRTPVHDAFARLEREKMLVNVPRGALVPRLRAESIRLNVWMFRTMCRAVLGELYNHHFGSLIMMKKHIVKEQEALQNEDQSQMIRLYYDFYREMFRLARRDLVIVAMQRTSFDMCRLLGLLEDRQRWTELMETHEDMVHALAKHHYEDSIEAMETGFDLYEPILTLCQQQYPQYSENPKGVEEI